MAPWMLLPEGKYLQHIFSQKLCSYILYLLLGYDYYFYQTDSSSSKGRQYLKILKMCDGPQDTRRGDMNYINKIFGL